MSEEPRNDVESDFIQGMEIPVESSNEYLSALSNEQQPMGKENLISRTIILNE